MAEDRHAVSGYPFFLDGGAVFWSKRTEIVSLSTAQSEYSNTLEQRMPRLKNGLIPGPTRIYFHWSAPGPPQKPLLLPPEIARRLFNSKTQRTRYQGHEPAITGASASPRAVTARTSKSADGSNNGSDASTRILLSPEVKVHAAEVENEGLRAEVARLRQQVGKTAHVHALAVNHALYNVTGMVIQLVNLDGLKVIASAGSEEKVQFMNIEIYRRTDVTFNYNTTEREVLAREVLAREAVLELGSADIDCQMSDLT
ncbi:hypothetical protein GGX14DRAFT_596032 [Mycena pura]|uniref:Uncharacterized protein n=1 Tax=Mycena pura TaxID=153505 RepID=A0AAD6UPZ3_9AGAR|nr:hypothetical protein GGX14DRAFT_596032 [Mycena pura]